jgi:hypothetical protein
VSRLRASLTGGLALALIAAGIGLSACGGSSSDPPPASVASVRTSAAHPPPTPALALALASNAPRAAAHGCPTRAAARHARAELRLAEERYAIETRGSTTHADLRYVAHDSLLLDALRSGNLAAARAQVDILQHSQIVKHVTRIRILRGSHVLIDGWPTSFDVGGSERVLRSGGQKLGRVQITIQDVIGFVKLEHRRNATEVLVRGAAGQVRTLLPAVKHVPLPVSGCALVGGRQYVVSSFKEDSFTGEPVTIWLLTAA